MLRQDFQWLNRFSEKKQIPGQGSLACWINARRLRPRSFRTHVRNLVSRAPFWQHQGEEGRRCAKLTEAMVLGPPWEIRQQ
eukprot:1111675-Pyramimonas_sp.AAC.1